MSPTNANHRRHGAIAGFTLVELIVSVSLSAIIFAGILGGYTFLARSFTRLRNTQDQDTKSRRAVYVFSQDVSRAEKISTASNTQLTLLLPATPPASSPSVSYSYSVDAQTGKGSLTRTENSGSPVVLLTDLTTLGFSYFNTSGSTASGPLSVKEVEFTFTSTLGNSAGGTRANYAATSPRLVLRNKALLQ